MSKHGMLQTNFESRGAFFIAVDHATNRLEQYLVNNMLDKDIRHRSGLNSKAKLVDEAKQYFKLGNCGRIKSEACASVNPTFLQPITGKWFVHYRSCPFESYLPIPWKIFDEKNHHQDGTVRFRYCQGELKKLLVAFRERMEWIKFYFHPCSRIMLR